MSCPVSPSFLPRSFSFFHFPHTNCLSVSVSFSVSLCMWLLSSLPLVRHLTLPIGRQGGLEFVIESLAHEALSCHHPIPTNPKPCQVASKATCFFFSLLPRSRVSPCTLVGTTLIGWRRRQRTAASGFDDKRRGRPASLWAATWTSDPYRPNQGEAPARNASKTEPNGQKGKKKGTLGCGPDGYLAIFAPNRPPMKPLGCDASCAEIGVSGATIRPPWQIPEPDVHPMARTHKRLNI